MPYTSPNLTYNVTLDVECERATPIIRIGQGTDLARIKVTFMAGDTPMNIDTTETFATFLWIQTPDGEQDDVEGKFVTEGGKVYAMFSLSRDLTEMTGRCYANVDFRTNSTGDTGLGWTTYVRTQVFYIDIEGFPEKKNYNGVNIVQISKKQFDDLPSKDPNTLYLVHDGDVVYLYLGDTQVGGSGGYNEVQGDVFTDNVTEG